MGVGFFFAACTGEEVAAVGGENRRPNKGPVVKERLNQSPRFKLVKAELVVVAAGEDVFAIRRKNGLQHAVLGAFVTADFLVVFQVPHGREIAASDQDIPGVRQERHAVDPASLQLIRSQLLARGRLPQSHGAIAGTGQDLAAIGRERKAAYPVLVALEASDFLAGGSVPE